MKYKENCKQEGVILTRFKIARMYFTNNLTQQDIANHLECHLNTVSEVVKLCKQNDNTQVMGYLTSHEKVSMDILEDIFRFLDHQSRKPKTNYRCIPSKDETLLVDQQKISGYGSKRLLHHLQINDNDLAKYSLAKIKGVYKRNNLKKKKRRAVNGEVRSLYDYDKLAAFEQLQYDTKEIADQHALPQNIYDKYISQDIPLPKYQWTIICVKTKVRFLAWSYTRNAMMGLTFFTMVVSWLRMHGIIWHIDALADGGYEFFSASQRKLDSINEELVPYNASMSHTEGAKWKNNIVERSHRSDDEEFYCPRGDFFTSTNAFLIEAQNWIKHFNTTRPHQGIGLKGITPQKKLEKLGFYNAQRICEFPALILDEISASLIQLFNPAVISRNISQNTQNVLHHYPFQPQNP